MLHFLEIFVAKLSAAPLEDAIGYMSPAVGVRIVVRRRSVPTRVCIIAAAADVRLHDSST